MALDKKNVIWVDSPPPSNRHNGTGRPKGGEHPFWAKLRARPMKWAIIPISEHSAGPMKRFHTDFEIVVRSSKVYARYLGEN